ncbi:MAG TPA: ATP synthase F1 subunit gamma [Deltaproteobacteria bacterium]|nr:ATP synthase F1 subunit gamma [Deltaproteobacteria bacterium]HCP45531.1 ATP synthase F1 subunit gamma [Deltaproteobacteria bacterium]
MPSLKALKTRIASVKSTQQITRAMKLVAAAKMKRAIDSALASRPYSDEVTAVLQSLMARIDEPDHPLLQAHDEVKNVAVIAITSDRGLCGGFNNGLLRNIDAWLSDLATSDNKPEGIEMMVYGKKSRDHFQRRDANIGRAEVDLNPKEFPDMAAKLIHELTTRYESGELDEVYLAYNRFVNTLKQEPVIEKLFPLNELASASHEEPETLVDFVYEPSQKQILKDILPLFLSTRVQQVFLESMAGEHAARMTAMDSATRNAKDVIDRLTLEYNRARQAAITRELVEIVAGAEAL